MIALYFVGVFAAYLLQLNREGRRFPWGILTLVILGLIALGAGHPALMQAAFYMIAAGILSGLAAALFGLIDFLGIPSGTRAKRIGLLHGVGNVVVVGLFALSWWLRRPSPSSPGTSPRRTSPGTFSP